MRCNRKSKKISKLTCPLGIVVSAIMLSNFFLFGGCSSDETVTNAEGDPSLEQEILSSSDINYSSVFQISSSQLETSSSLFLTVSSSSVKASSSSYMYSSNINSSSSKRNFPEISGSYLIDNRDENKYKLVTIGEQTWFAENLKYISDSSWCYKNSLDSCEKYGRLYQWHSAMNISEEYIEKYYNSFMDLGKKDKGLCPIGWHLPNLNDWEILLSNIDSLNNFQGLLLKSADYWKGTGNGYNTYDFNAFPAGYYNQGMFGDIGYTASFWSSIEDFENKQNATSIRMSSENKKVSKHNLSKKEGVSVRCVADAIIEGTKKIDIVKKVYSDSVEYFGHIYPTVEINGQVWFAENLIVETDASECPNDDNCSNGRIYQWHSAMNIEERFDRAFAITIIKEPHQGICPSGWHIPSKNEWDILANNVIGGKEFAGAYLKSSSWMSQLESATNVDLYGFNFVPIYNKTHGYAWSITEKDGDLAYIRGGYSYDKFLDEDYVLKNGKYLVRCIKD